MSSMMTFRKCQNHLLEWTLIRLRSQRQFLHKMATIMHGALCHSHGIQCLNPSQDLAACLRLHFMVPDRRQRQATISEITGSHLLLAMQTLRKNGRQKDVLQSTEPSPHRQCRTQMCSTVPPSCSPSCGIGWVIGRSSTLRCSSTGNGCEISESKLGAISSALDKGAAPSFFLCKIYSLTARAYGCFGKKGVGRKRHVSREAQLLKRDLKIFYFKKKNSMKMDVGTQTKLCTQKKSHQQPPLSETMQHISTYILETSP